MDITGIQIITGQLIEADQDDAPDGAVLFTSDHSSGGPISVALIPAEAELPEGWTRCGFEAGYVLGWPDDIRVRGEDGKEVEVHRAVILSSGADPGCPDGHVVIAVVPIAFATFTIPGAS